MSLKLSYNNEIHKISKIPTTFKALISAIKDSYSNLPSSFSLHYIDSDDDCIMLANDSDLNCFVSSLKDGSIKSTPKIFIVLSDNEPELSRASSHEVVDKESIAKLLDKEPIVEIKPVEISPVVPEEKIVEVLPVKTEEKVEVNPYFPVEVQLPVAQDISRDESAQSEPEIHSLISDVVYSNIPEIAMLVRDFLMVDLKQQEAPKPKKTEEKAIHHNIICDGCSVTPIVGVRYQCSVLKNFDLCEKCEAIIDHPYPLLKLKKPKVEGGNCSVFRFLDLAREGNCSTIYFEGIEEKKENVEIPVVEVKVEKKEEPKVEKKEEPKVEKKEVVVEKKEEKVYEERVKKLFEQLNGLFPELKIEKVDEFYQIDKNITFDDCLDNLLN